MKRPVPIHELGPFQFVIVVLSLFVLGMLAVEVFVEVPPELSRIFRWIDTAVCFVFLADFIVRFSRAESELGYMKWGWIDLLASIPQIEALRWARLFRIFRILRHVASDPIPATDF